MKIENKILELHKFWFKNLKDSVLFTEFCEIYKSLVEIYDLINIEDEII